MFFRVKICLLKYWFEMDGGVTTPPRRRPTATSAKTGVARRILKKHLQQKYLLCGFAIHVRILYIIYLHIYVCTTKDTNLLVSVSDTGLSLWNCCGEWLGYGNENLATDYLSSNSSNLPICIPEHHHGILWQGKGSPSLQTIIYCIHGHNEHSIRHQRKFILISLDYGHADFPNNSFYYLWMLWRWVSLFFCISHLIHHFSSSSSSLAYLVCWVYLLSIGLCDR